MKVIGIGGEPASGKSTLIQGILRRLEARSKGASFGFGLVRGTYYGKDDVFVLGVYSDQERFGGTDRLSMAVQPDAIKFLVHVLGKYPRPTILFEGDRLFNASFLKAVTSLGEGVRTAFWILKTDREELDRRRHERRDTQTSTFKRSRATKYYNLLENAATKWMIQVKRNQTVEDRNRLESEAFQFISS